MEKNTRISKNLYHGVELCRKERTVTGDCEKVFVTPKCQKIVKTYIQFWLDVKSNLTAPRGLDFIWDIPITYRTQHCCKTKADLILYVVL